MQIEQIAPHLWWWTAPHPDWTDDSMKDGQGWERDVSCYALVHDDALVLFDPLVPQGEEGRFWEALDRDVEAHGPPSVLVTVFWHARSADEIRRRYEGASVWAHDPSADQVRERVTVTDTFGDGDVLAGGVEAVGMHHMGEAAFWLPSHRTLVLGDSVLGYEDRVELSPPSWLKEGESHEEQQATVRRALERRPELLLLTHGGPRPASQLQL